MSATSLTLTIEPGVLDTRSCWSEFESFGGANGQGSAGSSAGFGAGGCAGAVD